MKGGENFFQGGVTKMVTLAIPDFAPHRKKNN